MISASLGLRMLMLWVSLYGHCLKIKKANVDIALAPVVATTSIGLLIFIAGILNVMPFMTYAICLMGVAFCVQLKPWRNVPEKREILILSVFTALCLLFAIRLKGVVGLHYDNFSHWLTVATEMLKTDQMPSFRSALIRFQSYPTGSAGYIYYFCKILGDRDDGVMLFAQSTMLAACLTGFLVFVRRFDICAFCIWVLGSLYCLVANIGIDELLVDTLIAMLGLAGLSIVIYYRGDLKRAAILSSIIHMFLVAVKSSGAWFILINSALMVFLLLREKTLRHYWKKALNLIAFCLGCPMAIYFLWYRHVKYVFYNSNAAKHSVSISLYKSIFESKTFADIKEIVKAFIERCFSLNKSWLLFAMILLLLVMGYLLALKISGKSGKVEALVFGGILLAYLGFMASMLLMYLFSMPTGEAVVLAGYERYEKQMLIYCAGTAVIYSLHLCDSLLYRTAELKRNVRVSVSLGLILVFGCMLMTESDNLSKLFVKENPYSGSLREQLTTIKSQYALEDGKKMFLYGNNTANDAGYAYYLGRYVFWSNHIETCNEEKIDERLGDIENYDYIIIVQPDETINSALHERNIPLGETVYRISDYSWDSPGVP